MLRSTVPTHSWAAWPSFLTGVDPADHGVYDILETVPGTHKQYPVTYRSIRERTFVEAARAQGASPLFVLRRHVLPHVLPVVIAYAALSVGWAVLFESALGFLGAGVQEPTPSIGGLLGCCLIYYRSQPGLILFPTIYLALLVTAANLVGEGLRRPLEGGR